MYVCTVMLWVWQGLYCCVMESTYYSYATVPCFIATFGGFVVAMYFYWSAVQICGSKVSERPSWAPSCRERREGVGRQG